MKSILFCVVLLCFINCQSKDDLVHTLPDGEFYIYSGYLTADPKRKLHYILTESQENQDSEMTPLVIWFNGGPGCSSLEGFASEIGPFVFMTDQSTTLEFNPYSWNKQAHILFIEAPAGVGFSTNDESLDTYQFSDENVAQDNFNALQDFYVKFPNYSKNPLWIAGESYGGIYAPTLAYKVHEDGKFNLKGILSGNGALNLTGYNLIFAETRYTFMHNLASPQSRELFNQNCEQNFDEAKCDDVLFSLRSELQYVNPYNIYDYCFYDGDTFNRNVNLKVPLKKTIFKHTAEAGTASIPCVSVKQLDVYFNRNDVKRALNVPTSIQYYLCIEISGQQIKYQESKDGSMVVLRKLFDANKYKFLFYSGDADSVVPYIDTLKQLKTFNLTIKRQWQPYFAGPHASQMGGFVQSYEEGITFATVRGAGHMVPFYKRKESFYIFNQTLNEVEL